MNDKVKKRAVRSGFYRGHIEVLSWLIVKRWSSQIKQIKQNEYFFSSTITKNYQHFFETQNAAVRSLQKTRQGLLPALSLNSFVKRL